MPPRVQYNYKEKVWWSERFQESHFTGTDAKRRFYNHSKAEIDNKAGDLYEKCKGKRYKLPPTTLSGNGFIPNTQLQLQIRKKA